MHPSSRQKSFLAAVSLFSLFMPSLAHAGVVPYPKTDTVVTAFRPSAPLASSGQFSDASTISLAVSGYGVGACVPVLVKATNTSNKTGDMRLTLVYPYEHGTQIGVNQLEGVSATVGGDPQSGVDNLGDLSFSGTGLNNVTSFILDDGSIVSASVEGPYRGDNTGKSPLKNEAESRHYNLELASVPSGRTAYITTCARMSADTNVIIDQYAVISVKLGGQDGGNAYIAKSPTVLPPSPKLTVNSVVINNDGGSKTEADFTVAVNGNSVSAGVANEFAPGNYTVSGSTDGGYTQVISGDCTSGGAIALAYGDTKQCTVTYDDIPALTGTLTVNMIIVNDDGGTMETENFPVTVNSLLVTLGSPIELLAGGYQVVQVEDTGYETTFSGDCDVDGFVNVTVGASATCTITNNDIAPQIGTLTVNMIVINDNGGALTAADFPVTLNSLPLALETPITLLAGGYQVIHTENEGYTTVFSGDCGASGNVIVPVGGAAVCTITNDDVNPGQSTLTVTTIVINDQGGANVVQDFPLFVNGNPVISGQATDVAPGTYAVTETEDPGYLVSYSGDCDASGNVTIGVGEDKNCIITNNDLPVGLTIVTKVINDNGGVAVASDFTTFIQGVGVPFTIFQGNADGFSIELGAGPYNVGQVLLDGYDAFFSTGCFGFINEGERLVCTITNDDL